MSSAYFLMPGWPATQLVGEYAYAIVFMAFLVASLGGFATSELVTHARKNNRTSNFFYGRVWSNVAAIVFGGAVFSMHFISMEAFRLPNTVRYDLGLTLVSMALPMLSSVWAMRVISANKVSRPAFVLSALLMGSGVAGMHYIGMQSLQAAMFLRFSPGYWLASVGLAMSVAGIGLWLMHYICQHRVNLAWRAASAVVIGLAVMSMHYTGMAASHFYSDGVCGTSTSLMGMSYSIASMEMLWLVIVFSFFIFGGAIVATAVANHINWMNERAHFASTIAHQRRITLIGQMSAGVSHEFNNLLGVIQSHIDIIEMKAGEDSKMQKNITAIAQAAQRGRQLVEQLNVSSRSQDSQHHTTFNLAKLLRESDALLATGLPGVRFRVHIDCGGRPCLVKGDPQEFQQVLINLCANAKFAVAQVAAPRVILFLKIQNENKVVLTFHDNGCGMPPEVAARVFEPFFTTHEVGKGSGLGLSMVHGLVQGMGGTVQVDSKLGEGTNFVFEFPLLN